MSAEESLALMMQRRDRIREWLAEAAPLTETQQRHLEHGTPEQAYWHHGYQAALNDLIDLLGP